MGNVYIFSSKGETFVACKVIARILWNFNAIRLNVDAIQKSYGSVNSVRHETYRVVYYLLYFAQQSLRSVSNVAETAHFLF